MKMEMENGNRQNANPICQFVSASMRATTTAATTKRMSIAEANYA